MNALTLEAAIAAHVRACVPEELEVREGTSSEVLPEFDPMILVQVTESQHLAGGLHSATVFIAAVSPALIEGATGEDHAERLALVQRAFADWQYPRVAAACMKTGGLLLQGMYVQGNGVSRKNMGRWIDGIELAVGIETAPLWSAPGALGSLDLRALDPELPDDGAYRMGTGSMLDGRDDDADCPGVVVTAGAQIVVPLVGTITLDGSPVPYIVRAWDAEGWGVLNYVAQPGAIVVEGWVD